MIVQCRYCNQISMKLGEAHMESYFWSIASMNCPMTNGTLWMRLISSCALTNSLFKLLCNRQQLPWIPKTGLRTDRCSSLMYSSWSWIYLHIVSCWHTAQLSSTHSRCRWSFFNVEYSSDPSVPKPSKESIFGIDDGICFRWGKTWFAELSTIVSAMM
jgi:hypothetical protein